MTNVTARLTHAGVQVFQGDESGRIVPDLAALQYFGHDRTLGLNATLMPLCSRDGFLA
jgi:hypothetical protein